MREGPSPARAGHGAAERGHEARGEAAGRDLGAVPLRKGSAGSWRSRGSIRATPRGRPAAAERPAFPGAQEALGQENRGFRVPVSGRASVVRAGSSAARRRGAGDSAGRQPRAAGRAAGRRSERRAVPGLRPTRRRKRKAAGPEIRPGPAPGQRVPDPLARRPAPHLQRAGADTLSGRLAAAPPPGPRLPGRPAAPARAPARSSHRRAAPPRAAEETRRSRAPPAAAIAGGRVTTGCDAGGAAAAARGSPRAGGRGPRRGRAGGCRSGPARAARRPPRRRGDL